MAKSISERILEGSRSIRGEFHTHPFVMGIADGTLSIEKFRYFMIQDYLYLIDYAKVFSIGAAKARDMSIMQTFSNYTSAILSGEMDIHRGYMKRLGINDDEIKNTRQAQRNLSYTSYMLRVAYEGGPAEVCAAILPCAVSYEEIARKMVRDNPSCTSNEFFKDWIEGYSCEAYHDENEMLISLTDAAAKNYNEEQIQILEEIGERCCVYEKLFWDMSWEMK